MIVPVVAASAQGGGFSEGRHAGLLLQSLTPASGEQGLSSCIRLILTHIFLGQSWDRILMGNAAKQQKHVSQND